MKELFRAFIQNDEKSFIEVANTVIKNEERKNHILLAKELRKILNSSSDNGFRKKNLHSKYKTNIPIPRDTEKGFPLLEIKEYYLGFNDIVVTNELKSQILNIIDEYKNTEILASYGLKPKSKILFCGPPGTGKTLSSKIISSVLNLPMILIRFDSIVSSYLGETANNLRKIFDFIEYGEWVVLFDEFDIIGKRRDDPHEHGEIKRVVNNFMQMLDNFNGRSMLIAATNHQHLLDTAIWRRFDDILRFDIPDENNRFQLFKKYLALLEKSSNIDLKAFAELTQGFSPADIARVCESAIKRIIIDDRKTITNEDIINSIGSQRNLKKIIEQGEFGDR